MVNIKFTKLATIPFLVVINLKDTYRGLPDCTEYEQMQGKKSRYNSSRVALIKQHRENE